jgi:hypothetical protein
MAEVELKDVSRDGKGKGFEIVAGITLTFFAAVLAISDLGGSKYGDDEILGANAKASVYAWYQSKSIKQSLAEGQRDLIMVLLDSGSIKQEEIENLKSSLTKLDSDIARYVKEKKELTLGSAKVGKENWIQDVEGELGKVIGAKEWEEKLAVLGRAGDWFDMSMLFMQLSLVFGAISLVLQSERMKWVFYGSMIALGLVGAGFTFQAFCIAMSVD